MSVARSESLDFLWHERAFAEYIRAPELNPRPEDVDSRRMAVYTELFYNNIEGLLAGNFPVLRRITPDGQWHDLVRDFFARHRCRTPYFVKLAEEFLEYLGDERDGTPHDPPFLLELAHYEWVELALSLSDMDTNRLSVNPEGDVLYEHPVVSPLAWRLRYRFAVHRIGPDNLPNQPGVNQTHLLVYRDRMDRIGFIEVNPAIFALLDLLEQDPVISGAAAVAQVVNRLKHPAPEQARQWGVALLEDLRQRDILLGTI